MALTKNSYTKSGGVNGSRLRSEYQESAILTAWDHIEQTGDAVDIYTKDALSTGDKTILDTLVTAHVNEPLPEASGTLDNDGDSQVRIKEAKKGWHVQPHFVDLFTSRIGQDVGEYDKDLTVLGWSTLKYYKLVNDVLTLTTDEDDSDQVVATTLDFSPPFDFEIKSGEIKVKKTPTDHCYLFPVGVPDIPAVAGGSKAFATGGIDLRFIESGSTEIVESMASKYMPRSTTGVPDGWTNKVQLFLRHHAGIQVHIQFKFGILAE